MVPGQLLNGAEVIASCAGAGEGAAREDDVTANLGPQSSLHIAPEAFAAALEQKALGAEKLMECVVKVSRGLC